MDTARYLVRLLEADNCFMTTTIHLCEATCRLNALNIPEYKP